MLFATVVYGASTTPETTFTSQNMPILGSEPLAIDYPVEDSTVLVPRFIEKYASTTLETEAEEVLKPESTTDVIRRYFGKDSALMIKIAKCESDLTQHNKDGSVLKGKITPLDRGVFQISLKYHQEEIDELGLDIHTLEDNVKYAKILFDRNGTNDWYLSEVCWNQ